MKKVAFLLIMVSLNCIAASMDVVITGQRFDGIHRTQNGDFLVSTGEIGNIIRFDAEGNQSVILSNGAYFVSVVEDTEGNIYASDLGAGRIIKINANGTQEVFTSSIPSPANMVQAADGTFYVSSFQDNGGVYQANQSGDSSVLIDGNLATRSLASTFDSDGNFYVSNSITAEIFRYTPSGDFSSFAQLPITSGAFRLGHLAFADGFIYATGYSDNRVYRVSLNGDVIVAVGPGALGEAGTFELNGPAGISAGNQPGEIYVTNYNSGIVNRIQLDTVPENVISQPAGLSGSWFDPQLAGEGYNVVYTNEKLLIYFYGYNDQGERMWLISELYEGEMNFDEVINLTLLELTGGTFAVPASPVDDTSVWGTLEVTFSDCKNGLFKLDGVDGEKVSNVTLLAGITGVICL